MVSRSWTSRALDLFFRYFDYPALVYGVIFLPFHPSWSGLALIILLYIGGSSWQAVATNIYNASVYFKLVNLYLFRYRFCSFERCDLSHFLPEGLLALLLRERLGIGLTGMPLGYVCIVKRRKGFPGQPWPGAMTMFSLETLPWYIMSPYSIDEISPYQRFILLHEIGHSSLFHKISLDRKLNISFQSGLLMTLFWLTSELDSVASSIIGGAILLWWAIMVSRHVRAEKYEDIADYFAVLFMPVEELEAGSREFLKWAKHSMPANEFEKRSRFLHSAIAHRTGVMGGASLAGLHEDHNDFAAEHAWPRWYCYLPLLPAFLLSIRGAEPIGLRVLLLVTLVSFIIPAALWLGVRLLVSVYEERVEAIMKRGEVSEEMLSPAFRRWEVRSSKAGDL